MGKVTSARVREAAEDLVQWRYGVGTFPTASDAGGDMRDWQLSGSKVMAAAKSAVRKTSKQPTKRKQASIQSQITNAMHSQSPVRADPKPLHPEDKRRFPTAARQYEQINSQPFDSKLRLKDGQTVNSGDSVVFTSLLRDASGSAHQKATFVKSADRQFALDLDPEKVVVLRQGGKFLTLRDDGSYNIRRGNS